jgi:hypothetical protein
MVCRYWKLRAKGFHPESKELRSYLVNKVKESVSNRQLLPFFCRHIRAGRFKDNQCVNATGTNRFAQRFIALFVEDNGEEYSTVFEE